jgi:hypothetical protein
MPDTFTFEEAAAPAAGTGESFSFAEAQSPDAFSFEDALPPREREKRKLQGEAAALRAEPPAPVLGGSIKGLAADAVSGFGRTIGAGLKGLGTAAASFGQGGPEDMEGHAPGAEQQAAQQLALEQNPLAKREVTQETPFYKLGKIDTDYYNELYQKYVPENERETLAHQVTGDVVGLAPAMSGPAAPFVFGLISAGEHFDGDYDKAIEAGKKPEEAAQIAADNAILSGAKEAALWEFGPKALRGFIGEKIASKIGEKGALAWFRAKLANALPIGGTSAASRVGENAIEGEPLGKDVGTAFVSGTGLGFALPGQHRVEAEPGAGTPPPPPGTPGGGTRPTTPEPPKPAPVTRDLVAELKAAMVENQILKAQAEPLVQAVAEKVKADLVDQAAAGTTTTPAADKSAETFTYEEAKENAPGRETERGPKLTTVEPNQRPGLPESDAQQSEQGARAATEPDANLTPAAEEVKPKRVAKGARMRDVFDRETEMNGSDILDWLKDAGPLLSKTVAKKRWKPYEQNKSLWDDAPVMQRPHHNVIYGRDGGLPPDQVAQMAYEAGRLSAPDVNELWSEIDKASKTRAKIYRNQRLEAATIKNEIEQNKAWKQLKVTGEVRVDAHELEPGDWLELKGERLKVTDKDPETGDITVEDGSKFGRQRVAGDESIYVEKVSDDVQDRIAENAQYAPEAMHDKPANLKEHPGDPKLWNVSDTDLEGMIEAQPRATAADRARLETLEREAKERGLIDSTSADEEARQRAEEESKGKTEAEAERQETDPGTEPDDDLPGRERDIEPSRGHYGSDRRPGESEHDAGQSSSELQRPAAAPGSIELKDDKVLTAKQKFAIIEVLRRLMARHMKEVDRIEARMPLDGDKKMPEAIRSYEMGNDMLFEDAHDAIISGDYERVEYLAREVREKEEEYRRSYDYPYAKTGRHAQLVRERWLEGQKDALHTLDRVLREAQANVEHPGIDLGQENLAEHPDTFKPKRNSEDLDRLKWEHETEQRRQPSEKAYPEKPTAEQLRLLEKGKKYGKDKIERLLDKAIDITKPGTDWTGQTSMGLAKIPVWLGKEAIHGALRVIRAAYRAGKNLKQAIEAGVEWLADQDIKEFDRNEARAALTDLAENAEPMVQRQTPPIALPAIGDKVEFQLGRQTVEGKVVRHVDNYVPGAPEPKIPVIRTSMGDEIPAPEYFDSGRVVEAKNGTKAPQGATEPPEGETNRPETETPADGDRTWETVYGELQQAQADYKAAVEAMRELGGQARRDKQAERNRAAARVRTLRDELKTHPGFVSHLLLENERIGNELQQQGLTPERKQELEADREHIQAALQKLEPRQVSAVYAKLQDEGKIAKPPPGPPLGRSFDELNEWLQKADIGSPKRTLLERLDLAGQLAKRVSGVKDGVDAARLKLTAMLKAALEIFKGPIKDTGFREVMKEWIAADQRTGRQNHEFVQEINKQVESPLRQMAISVWMDANGDESLLRYQATAVPERYRAVWQTALKLTEGEKDLARRLQADFAQKLDDGYKAGLIKQGREQYGVPQSWKKAPEVDPAVAAQGYHGKPGSVISKLDPRDPFFAFQRSHPTYFDGIMAGGVPADLRISYLASLYNAAFHKALSSRGMIWALKNEVAADGRPVVKVSGRAQPVSDGEHDGGAILVDSKSRDQSDVSADGRPYMPVDHFALRDWKVAFKTADGKPVIVRGDMLVHPDHFAALHNELASKGLSDVPLVGALLRSGAFLKASKLAGAGFHMMTIGEHMLSHLANPFTIGFKLDLRDPDQALLVRNGLELGMSGPMSMFSEGTASHGGLFRQIPGIGDLSGKFTDWMFRDYIPKIMMKVGLKALQANRRRYSDKLSESELAELTAQQMNAAGGLLNKRLQGASNNFWSRLGADKRVMDFNRLLLLAPQFLEARARVVAQAFKPYGAEQRKMLIVQALTMYVGARVLNQLLNDDPHWEEKALFGVVYHGKLYSIRTIVGDAWHAVSDPKSFAAGRLSPWGRLFIETVTQRDLRTGARKEPPMQTEWMPSRVVQNALVDVARWLMPIGSEGFLPGAAGREQTAGGMALASLGIGSRKYTPAMQVQEWARDFNRKGDPAARTFQRHQDADAHADSAYRKLDALLDAGNLKQAQTEYLELLKDGHKATAAATRYNEVNRAFTGRLDREKDFRAGLNAAQKQIYDRAIAERKARNEAFQKMLATMRN